jgi:hypothetical protein
MEWNDSTIKQLLEKYFDGTTTIEEENVLKSYFTSANVAPHLESYRSLFVYFKQEQNVQFDQDIHWTSVQSKRYNWLIAASIAILIGVGTLFALMTDQSTTELAQTDLGTYTTPEEAYEATQNAITLVAGHLNTGIESMEYLNEYEQSKNLIFKK